MRRLGRKSGDAAMANSAALPHPSSYCGHVRRCNPFLVFLNTKRKYMWQVHVKEWRNPTFPSLQRPSESDNLCVSTGG